MSTEPRIRQLPETQNQQLLQRMMSILSPPLGTNQNYSRALLNRFYSERWPRRSAHFFEVMWPVFGANPDSDERFSNLRKEHLPRYSSLDNMLRRVASGRPLLGESNASERMSQYSDALVEEAPKSENIRAKLTEVLLPRYAWTCVLAKYYLERSRRAILVPYVLAALVVVSGVISLVATDIAEFGAATATNFGSITEMVKELAWHKMPVFQFEFFCLLLIPYVTARAYYMGWIQRARDYGTLADRLGHGRFLAFISEFGRPGSRTGYLPRNLDWVIWYYRSTVREIGLPGTKLDGLYQWELLDVVRRTEVEEQTGHELLTARRLRKVGQHLEKLISICFIMALLTVTVTLISIYADIHLPTRIVYMASTLSVLFPVIGMALSAVRLVGDFAASADRSARMSESLVTLKSEFVAAEAREQRLADTIELLVETSRVMSEDNLTWQELFGGSRASLGI